MSAGSPIAPADGRSGPAGALRAKYASERLLAIALLALLLPPFAVIAVAIRRDSPGPIFFRQLRVGAQGRLFRIYKFRTMVAGAEKAGLACAANDDRITRVGRRLRQASLDELPQLINVALGQMSLIGPRPTVPSQVAHYTERQRRRLDMRPGITGWAQVNGRNALSWVERMEFDVWYVEHWSPGLDVRILMRTPLALLDPRGLYGERGVTEHFTGECG